MLRYLLQVFLGLLLSFPVFALNGSNSIFYPLPSQAEGTFVAAKQLFLGAQGGLWIHDVHGRVLFYDGQNTLPKSGSFLHHQAEQLTFHKGSFWTFVENEVYQAYPNQERQLIFSLNPGAQIRKIGASGNYIWVSDGANFYTYDLSTNELTSTSLLHLYQHSNNSYVYINDAIFIETKWVLATTSGVYLSDGERFNHVASSGKNYIEKVYYSPARREILVGTLKGALVFNIYDPSQPVVRIGESHVLTFAESNKEYWIGTEHGLYLYSFLTGDITKVAPASFLELELADTKIYALLNDNMGGMWIATNQGIRYYSLFSKQFERIAFSRHGSQSLSGRIRQTEVGSDGSLWFSDDHRLYRSTPTGISQVLQVPSRINAFTLLGGYLWLATSEGLELRRLADYNLVTLPFLSQFSDKAIDHLVSNDAQQIWLSSGYHLFNLDIEKQKVHSLGSDWIVSRYLPAKLTQLYAHDSSLLIGTDHGVYEYDGERIRFNDFSQQYGESVDMVTAADGAQWFASSYGVFKTVPGSRLKQVVELSVLNSRPACMVSDEKGVWLSSSVGLSYYRLSGQLLMHFPSSSGLINNEFLMGVCDIRHGGRRERTLFFGSQYGLVKADASTLLVSNTPESKLIVSQVVFEDKVVEVGSAQLERMELPYGSSLSFLFGVMPYPDRQNIYYRLNEGDNWQVLEGRQLTLEHLNTGNYHLQVSNDAQRKDNQVGLEARFTVLKPWYLSKMAIIGFVITLLLFVAVVVYWRSRYVVQANRELAAQVTLKTNQLRHQSRVLLNSNQQLRKQIQVRNLLVDHVALSIKASIDYIAENRLNDLDTATSDHLCKTYWQLNELKRAPESNNGYSQNYNLSQITQSIVDVWQEDFHKAGICVDLHDEEKAHRIALVSFNLDVIFNSIFANVIKRSFRGQSLKVIIEDNDESISLSFIDHGSQLSNKAVNSRLMNNSDLSIDNLKDLVDASGGDLSIFTSDAQNKIQICWPRAQEQVSVEESITEFVDQPQQEETMTAEREWLLKVYQLVDEHYHDAEFGTASAAKMLFMSERSLQRRFKSASSRTLKDYLTEVRLETACEQLLAGEKISEVAFNCGFNDPSYFSQKFKLHFGLPPSKFAMTQDTQVSA
ncbi:helix-turn-helix domain-containing protein [Vibrio alfacsensis]|uniref:AraC family transcriptional regulator n=1 Tax=Vibrio alfacsensis TaxID=1074311 RepID=UPI002ADE7822|nr:helix-turn-helix domain-containing protein [Vibrio alfacsensis]WQE76948.1 helix-turn-helix domain-containing protein [Vibrio alfacsensis]